MPSIQVRLATAADVPAINDIYNYYVIHCTCTYQTEIEPLQGREKWFGAHGPKHPVTVAERNGIVVGWGALSPFHARQAFARTVENSVYIHPEHQRQGIGRLILEDLLRRARLLGHHSIIAAISAEQIGSLILHKQFGFTEAGLLKEAGFKFGLWLDVAYLQKML